MNKSRKRTFDEIAAEEGEEAAIQAGIEADPDAFELDEDWFRHASPAHEMMPHVRASISWQPPESRTSFDLFVDKTRVASGQVSAKRDLFTTTSAIDETTHSFLTMRDAKNWAVEHYDFHHALADLPHAATSRAALSWASSDIRTSFKLSVDGTQVAEGDVSEKRDLFSIDSLFDKTSRSFRTMHAAKRWAINHFDSRRHPATPPQSSELRASFAWLSPAERDCFRLFVEEMLVAEGNISKEDKLYSLLSRLDGQRRTFSSMLAAKKWTIEHYCSFHEADVEDYSFHKP